MYPLISSHHHHHQHLQPAPSRTNNPATANKTTNNTFPTYTSRMSPEPSHHLSTTPPRHEHYYHPRRSSFDPAQPTTPQRPQPLTAWSPASPTEGEATYHRGLAHPAPPQPLTPLNRLNITQSLLPPWRRQPSSFWTNSPTGLFKPWPEPRSVYAQEQSSLAPLKSASDTQKKLIHTRTQPAHVQVSGVFIDSAKANLNRMAAYTNVPARSHKQASAWKGKGRMRSPPPPAPLSPPASLLPPTRRSPCVQAAEQLRRRSLTSSNSSVSTIPNVLQLTTNNQNVFASSQTRQHASYVVDNRKTHFELQATSHECFTMVGGKWTCYRRNYLKIDAVVKPVATIERKEREGKSTIYDPITDTHYQKRSRSPSTSSSSDSSLSAVPPSSTMLPEQSHRGRRTAPELFVTLTTHVANHHGEVVPRANEVSLVQFGPERERGTKTSVQPHTIVAGGSLSASTGGSGAASAAAAAAENASNVATFRRVQVRRATSKNGRLGDDSEQQYFILRLSLYTPSNSGFSIVREDDNHHQSAPSAPRHEEEDAAPPSKRPRRSATSAGAASASASTAGAGPSTYSRLEQQEEGTYASSSVHPQWVLLASLDSAPVTIRGRSRKHFAANVDSGSASTSTRMQRS